MAEKCFKLAVSVFIDNGNDEFLLIQRSSESGHYAGCWETPGGKVDEGESFDQALLREVKEETGLTISLDAVAGVTEFELPHIKVVMLYMKGTLVSGEVKLSHEHQDFQWCKLSEINTKELTPALRQIIKSLGKDYE